VTFYATRTSIEVVAPRPPPSVPPPSLPSRSNRSPPPPLRTFRRRRDAVLPRPSGPIARRRAPDVGSAETGRRHAPICHRISRGARSRAVVVILLDDPPPGETSDRVEAGRRRRPPRSDGSPGPLARWLHRCDGLRGLLLPLPSPPSSAASSRDRPPIPTTSVVGRLSFFAIAGRRGRRRHWPPRPRPPPSPDPVVPPPPPPAPSLAHPLPPTTHSSPATRGTFFRPGETAIDRASIVLDCLPLRETSRLRRWRGLRGAPPPLAVFPISPHLACSPHHYCPSHPTGSPSSVDRYIRDRRGIADSVPLPFPFTFFDRQSECTVDASPPSALYHLMVVACRRRCAVSRVQLHLTIVPLLADPAVRCRCRPHPFVTPTPPSSRSSQSPPTLRMLRRRCDKVLRSRLRAVVRDERTGGDVPGLERGARSRVVVVLDDPPPAETSDLDGGGTSSLADPTVPPGPPASRLRRCDGLRFLPSAPSPLASIGRPSVVHRILPRPPADYLHRRPISIFHESAAAADPPRAGRSDGGGWRIGP
jgi:hypothetical protein